MRRTLLTIALALVALVPTAWADRWVAFAPDLRVHEWGVWKLRQGEVAHLADLQRESPPFVLRTQPGSGIAGGGMVARKPVVYVYAEAPTDVDLEVAFRGGGPWLYYPGALPFACAGAARRDQPFVRAAACEPDRLHFRLRALPRGAAVALPAVAPGHFWHHLRDVPSSPLLSPDGTAERFIFYDGPVAFPPAYRVGRGSLGETTLTRVGPSAQTSLILAWGDRWVPVPPMPRGAALGIDRTQPWPVPPRAVADELLARVRAAGLSAPEARALVETWRPEIDAPGLRAFWLLARSEYDAVLPLRVAPVPREIVRVGVVIEDLGP